MTHAPLPEFDNPPVTEVALSVQFERLDSLKTPQLGYIWGAFRERFPKTEEQPPLEPVVEQFGPRRGRRPGVRLQLSPGPLRPRIWLINEVGTELVQIQQDRFIRNWRKQDDSDEYPRYTRLRDLFRDDFSVFCDLIKSQQWGAIEPNQCEVTYVNIIPAGDGWDDHGDLHRVLTVFSQRYSDDHLGKPEEASVSLQFILGEDGGEPVGRLHVSASPTFRISDNHAAIRLTLTARGKPEGTGVDGVMTFHDRGHEAIVRGFASITTPEMHEVWKRKS